MSEKNDKNRYQSTLNLPKTTFSIRANAAQKEPEMIERWKSEDLYEKTYKENTGKKKFVMHDGPPYANGPIHIGHALNKILKDLVCKSKRMDGYLAPFKPGWDCHGLPIELKVTAELKVDKNSKGFDRRKFKKACREYADKWIKIQKEEFEQLGVLADWEHPYITMDPVYESDILKAFARFIKDGYIERKGKTVPWCASCQTVLATAEIEYKDRNDPSIYILFPFDKKDSKVLFPVVLKKNPKLDVNFLVWTTTPWTIPLNRAVVLNPDAKYVLLQGKEKDLAFIVAEVLADKTCQTLEIDKKVLATFDSSIVSGYKVNHPIVDTLQVPLLLDDIVMLDEGTACLHSAPGCGPEDYIFGIKNNLEIFSPLDSQGKYTKGIEPVELEGMKVSDGQGWVIKKLQELGRLLHKQSISHSYPHCWRCHKGLIFRATDQWFCNLEKNNLVGRSLEETEKIKFIPSWGKDRFQAFINNRTEWCISRQREWGVPIPAIICKKCGYAYLSSDLVEKVAEKVAKHGIEYWDRVTAQKLIEDDLINDDFKCPGCKKAGLYEFRTERDILDVWFDSGVTNVAVLDKFPELGLPADLYLEGSDQHRGWFQSSLFASMILNDKAPMREILTHGFVVDVKGHKMSKSVGNVIAPQEVMKKLSRDILRLWVASADYEGDVIISDQVLKNVTEVYKKIRNTCRFMISNLYDFDIKKNAVEFEKLLSLDKYALAKLYETSKAIEDAYKKYDFSSALHILNNYCANDLSALYFDIIKDRLYVEKADGVLRRSAQTVVYHILDTVTKLMAPMLSFLSEEVSDYYQKDKEESIHLQEFVQPLNAWERVSKKAMQTYQTAGMEGISPSAQITKYIVNLHSTWSDLEQLRDAVLKSIEEKRTQNLVKHSLEAKVTLYLDPKNENTEKINLFIKDLQERCDNWSEFFKNWFIVSQIEFAENSDNLNESLMPGVFVNVEHAKGVKCPRCWQWSTNSGKDDLCPRCIKVLEE